MRLPLVIAALLLFVVTAMSGVKTASRWTTMEGDTVEVSARGSWTGQNMVTFADGSGASSERPGTPTPGGCAGETDDCAPGSTPDGSRFQISGGRVQQERPDGTWQNLAKAKDGLCTGLDEGIGGLPQEAEFH